MAVENIPWMIQGGKHSAASGRRVLFKATGGAEGVAAIGDLRVRQAAVANGTIIVAPGGAVMVNRYAGAKGESYDGQNLSDTIVNVPANGGGSTRYDLVIARIDDWNMPGGQATPGVLPTDTVAAFKFQIITGVAATVKTAKELNLGYPAIALARIAIPAATSAVTQAMITDLREMAVPRRQRSLNTRAVITGQEDTLDATATAGELWPNVAAFTVEIPEWATRARIVASWFGIKQQAGSSRTGYLWVRIANGTPSAYVTQTTAFDCMGLTQASRQTLGLADDVAIPAALRGISTTFHLFGRQSGGAGLPLLADSATSLVLDIEFLEAPTEDL